jgi:hypothetical protein
MRPWTSFHFMVRLMNTGPIGAIKILKIKLLVKGPFIWIYSILFQKNLNA